ncbi:unnamed protein product [Hymenolepis diminuta]|uniref:Histone domain-containing protein n=1 Tax=Hymenolepis diminuta TaxID=6216 RepID=A0A0R3S9X1_HYMDI|nr:unnamed protein product [Hymenolepis diminuta]VUZ41552.1 unnamed protein product [Hymenolepis diminuta]
MVRSRQSVQGSTRDLVVQTKRTRKYRSSIDRGDTLPIRQLSNKYQKQSLPRCRLCGEYRYLRDRLIEDFAAGTATKMVTKKASTESLLRAVQ